MSDFPENEKFSSSSDENNNIIDFLSKNKKVIGIIIGIIAIGFFLYNMYNLFNNKCPTDCKKYINGDITINGKICKVPIINGVKCPTNCVYEKVDKYVKYNDCNCDIETPIKTPKILVKNQGDNVIKCPTNIYCNDCKLIVKLADIIPTSPIKSDLILNSEPLSKSIYLTRFYLKLHAYSTDSSENPQKTLKDGTVQFLKETLESSLKTATVQIQFLSNIDNKSILPQQIINLSKDEQNKEIIFNISTNQPVLINSGSIIRLIFSNPNKDDIYIDYLSSLNIDYKHIL